MHSHEMQVGKMLYRLSQTYTQKISDESLDVYVSVLKNFEIESIAAAIESILSSKKEPFFPSLSEILFELNPRVNNEDEAQLMSDKIISTAARYGRYQQAEIKKNLSELEMQAMQSIGLIRILDSTDRELTVIRSQLRRTCKAILEKNVVEAKVTKLIQGNSSKDSFVSIGECISSLAIDSNIA